MASSPVSWCKNYGQLIYKIVILIVLAASAAGCIYLAVRPAVLKQGLEEVRRLGIWGNLILVAAYIVIAFPIAVGYTAACLACGFMYGVIKGTCTTVVGILIGSTVSYWLCGTLCKDWVERKVLENKKTEALLKAVRKHGFKIILMSRLTPVPFGLQNALFGISGIKFHWYLLATITGMLPEAILWCYFGSTIHQITDVLHGDADFGVWKKVLLASQIVAIVLLVCGLGFLGRHAMKKVMNEQETLPEVKESLLSNSDNAEDTPDQVTPKADV
jgi:uncharacterized membrane protein YdjX (TVP38/TMEM64 family)